MKAIVLAAGKGKRLFSETFSSPKVLREMLGKPLLGYVTDALSFLPKEDVVLVVGYRKEQVIEAFPQYPYAVQEEQLGTGHAVLCAQPLFSQYDGPVLVCCGDMPLVREESYRNLIETHVREKNDCTVFTGISHRETSFGRILRDESGNFSRVVEYKDCTEEEKKIQELNVGIYVFSSRFLFTALKEIKNENAQKEYYLTDVPPIIQQKGGKIGTYTTLDDEEILGVNTIEDLKICEEAYQRREES